MAGTGTTSWSVALAVIPHRWWGRDLLIGGAGNDRLAGVTTRRPDRRCRPDVLTRIRQNVVVQSEINDVPSDAPAAGNTRRFTSSLHRVITTDDSQDGTSIVEPLPSQQSLLTHPHA
jgi:hypothetical protein